MAEEGPEGRGLDAGLLHPCFAGQLGVEQGGWWGMPGCTHAQALGDVHLVLTAPSQTRSDWLV